MTRKEEIEKAAMQVAGIHPDWSKLDCFRMGFREGAKFADKTMLDRTCEWLSIYYPNIYRMEIVEFITAFEQAMKGDAE